mgnify:CR=1 FL=1
MPLPSFLQAMFTPTGPPRQRMDQGGGEYTGFIPGVYEGDDSSPIDFQRSITSRSVSGPTTRRLPDPLENKTGSGVNPIEQIGRDLTEEDRLFSALPGGASTISEVMETSAPIGNMSGGWADIGDVGMVSDPIFSPSEPSSLPSGPMFAPSEPSSLPSRPMFVPSESSTLSSPMPQDPMGSGVGGVRASNQRFTPPMAEDPGILESIKDKIVGMPAFHLNVADQVGTGGSRSQFKQDRANTLADELAFGASADSRNMRKQPPGFWDFATGGLLKGPSQYMPSAWNIDIPGQVNPGIEAQISEHAQQRKILEDRESMLRADGVPEFKIQQAMGQHYTGPMTEGTL